MKKKLNYRFHNPNSEEATAEYLLKIFMEANGKKVQSAIEAEANMLENTKENEEEFSA